MSYKEDEDDMGSAEQPAMDVRIASPRVRLPIGVRSRSEVWRELKCKHQTECLTEIDNEELSRWRHNVYVGMSCKLCKGFEPISKDDELRDIEGMAEMWRQAYKNLHERKSDVRSEVLGALEIDD